MMQGFYLFVFLCILPCLTFAEDIECEGGTTSTSIKLERFDSYTFTTKGTKYKHNIDCKAKYKLARTCTQATLHCTSFSLKASKADCSKGDKLTLKQANGTKIKYCQESGPENVDLDDNFNLLLETNDKGKST